MSIFFTIISFQHYIISDSTTVFLLKCVACKRFLYKKGHLFLYFLSNTTAFRHLKSCVSGSGFVSDRPPPQVSGLLSSESIPMITAEPHPDSLSLQTADIPRTQRRILTFNLVMMSSPPSQSDRCVTAALDTMLLHWFASISLQLRWSY